MAEPRGQGRPRLVRGLIFEAAVVLGIVVWGPLSLLAAPFPYRFRYWFITRWCRYVMVLLRTLCGIHWRMEGLENVPDRIGVVMCKHQSTWETLALQYWFQPQTWVLKRELMLVPVFGWALYLLEPIAVERGGGFRAFQQVTAQGRARLDRGRWVVVFPEGTRVPAGYKGRYMPGAAQLATSTGRPVIPIAHNAGEHWPRRRIRKIPGVIRARIGPPIETAGRRPAQVMAEVEAWIERQMPELSEGDYPGTPYRR